MSSWQHKKGEDALKEEAVFCLLYPFSLLCFFTTGKSPDNEGAAVAVLKILLCRQQRGPKPTESFMEVNADWFSSHTWDFAALNHKPLPIGLHRITTMENNLQLQGFVIAFPFSQLLFLGGRSAVPR